MGFGSKELDRLRQEIRRLQACGQLVLVDPEFNPDAAGVCTGRPVDLPEIAAVLRGKDKEVA